MHKFKKISSLLSVLLVLAISVGTFPLSALADYGFSIPNSSVLSDFAQYNPRYGGVFAPGNLPINESFPNPPSFSDRGNGSWGTSLSEKIFSIIVNDSTDFGLNGTANYRGCAYNSLSYDLYDNNTFYSADCYPIFPPFIVTNQNTSVSNYDVIITNNTLPPLRAPITLKESNQTTSVELTNDPNKVRVTINGNSALEEYQMSHSVYGEVVDSRPDGGYGVIPPYYSIQGRTFISIGGWTYVIELSVSSGIEQRLSVSVPLNGSVERARNSDIVAVTQSKCTLSSDDDWWSGNNWITDCIAYGLSADGRTGRAEAISETGRSGGFGEFVTAVVGVVSIVVGVGELFLVDVGSTLGSLSNLSGLVTGPAGLSTLSEAGAIAVAAMLQSVTDGTYGTVEQSIASSVPLGTRNGQWSWTWSELPPQPTVCPTGQIGTPPACTCANGLNISTYPTCVATSCPSGTTGVYPVCCTAPQTMNSSGVCADPVNGAPTISVYREPKTLYQGQIQVTHYETTNANSVSYSCTGVDNPFLTRSDGPPFGPYLESSWNALWGTGWKGPYSCTWTATGPGGTFAVQDNFNIMPPGTAVNTASDSKSVIVIVCSGTQIWNGSSCIVATPVTPVVPPVTPPSGGTPSGGDTPSGGTPGNQDGGNPNNQGGQNQGCQGNQGVSSVTISADPNRVHTGDTSTVTWCASQVNSCAITKNGTLWKSDISSSGESTPPEIITVQTTYTITCPSISPESVTVNILPVFQEF